jgi:hypothetical protein
VRFPRHRASSGNEWFAEPRIREDQKNFEAAAFIVSGSIILSTLSSNTELSIFIRDLQKILQTLIGFFAIIASGKPQLSGCLFIT